jgi:hypothetical protein
MSEENDAREVGERIATLLEELRAQTNPHAWAQVDQLLHTVLDLYGRALGKVLEVASGDGSAEELRAKLIADPLLTSLFVLHGIHPVDTRTRIERVLDGLRESPLAAALVSMDDNGGLRLRLEANRQRNASTSTAVQGAIERAIVEAAPEVTSIEFEGVPEAAGESGPLVQLNSRNKASAPETAA